MKTHESQKKSYLLNSFYFLYTLFSAHLDSQFDFTFTPPGYEKHERALFYVWRNVWFLKHAYRTKQINAFDIIHFNRPEAFLLYKKIPTQISIFEIHGFDIGVCGKMYLKDLHTPWKVWIGTIIDRLIEKKMIRKLQEPDILYVSTPDLVEPIEQWCGRKPIWLPNPIDTVTFSPEGPVKKLAGDPVCFLASRLHGDKKPEVAFDLFQNHILPVYPNAVLYLLETGELVEHYKKKFKHDSHYVWLPYMDKPTLASVIRGSDLVFGDFSIGALSMLPMQVMACKKPIVTLDRFEIVKQSVDDLPDLTLQILRNPSFQRDYVEKTYQHVLSVHAPERVCMKHLENMKRFANLSFEEKNA